LNKNSEIGNNKKKERKIMIMERKTLLGLSFFLSVLLAARKFF